MLEQSQNSAPQTPEIYTAYSAFPDWSKRDWNRAADWKLGVASAKADALNQMAVNKYNNDYNYWLWQQQTAYNSPVEQRKRLEAAGLNPNFNSIDGTGNATNPSPSQAKSGSNNLGAYQASVSAKIAKIQEANAIINGLNDLVKNIGEGFGIVRNYANTPLGISEYRSLLTNNLRNLVDLGSRNKDKANAIVNNLVAQTELSGNRNALLRWQMGLPSSVSDSSFYAKNFLANTAKTMAETSRIDNDSLRIAEDTKRILAQTGLINKQGYLTDKRAAQILAEIALTGIKTDIAQWERDTYNPQKVENLKKQWEIMNAALTRSLFQNNYLKADKYFDYITGGLGALSGAARSGASSAAFLLSLM